MATYYDQLEQMLPTADVHMMNNISAQYFRRYLLEELIANFKWTLPETWDEDYFKYTLYMWGSVTVLKTAKFGIIPQWGTLEGYNVFYMPRYSNVANPLLPELKRLEIGKDCSVIKLQPDYRGIMDIVDYYAMKLANCANAVDVNLMNSKLAYVFAAGSKAAADSFKKLFDKVAGGDPAVVVDKSLFTDDGKKMWDTFANNLTANYITSDILSDMRKIREMFLTEVGIPNANTDKRERLISDEVNANNTETCNKAEMWMEIIRKGIKQTEQLFPELKGKITVDWRHDPNESNTDDLRPVSIG